LAVNVHKILQQNLEELMMIQQDVLQKVSMALILCAVRLCGYVLNCPWSGDPGFL